MLRRTPTLAKVAAVAVLALAGTFIPGGTAHADGCRGEWSELCGGVRNDQSKTMSYTLELDSGGPHSCRVWNPAGGDHAPGDKILSCKQEPLHQGGKKGGYLSGVDVDAFTFPDTGYHVSFNGRPQTYHLRGYWTKISSAQFAVCKKYDAYKTPYCEITGA